MRYQCVSCDVTFELDGDKPRCPRCRKTSGLEQLPDAPPHKNVRLPLVAVALVAAIAGGYLWWSGRTPAGIPSEVPLRPLDVDELAAFARDRHFTDKRMPMPLGPSKELMQLALRAGGGASGRDALISIFDHLQGLREARAYHSYESSEPRDTEIRNAARTYSAIKAASGDALYSLELALVLAASARTVGADAMIVEVLFYPGERAPLDPSGYIGHFAVALAPPGKRARSRLEVFDLHHGVHRTLGPLQAVLLDDLAVLGHFMNHQALFRLAHLNDAAGALERVNVALELTPRGAPMRGTRGAILLASGGVREGIRELEHALHARRDAPRHHNLGAAYLVSNDGERAAREIGEALSAAPDYAAAHATLAALHITRGEAALALSELQTAERLDPDLATLPMLWANYYVAQHEPDSAVERAQQAVRLRPNDERSRLMLASLYRELGRILDMQAELRAALDRSHNREQLRDLIAANFGAAALQAAEEREEEDLSEGSSAAAAGADGGAGQGPDASATGLELGSKVLGTGAGGQRPGPHLDIGDGSGLRLGGPGELRLRLGGP